MGRAMWEAPQAVRSALVTTWDVIDLSELLAARRLPPDETKAVAKKLSHAAAILAHLQDTLQGFAYRGERSR
jgi:hypothetical protein